MPKSKDELRALIEDARKEKNASSGALKKLTDLHVPGGARKARRHLIARLRAVYRSAVRRIPLLRERLKRKQRDGASRAVKEARSLIGTREQPPGSNWGGKVTDFITFTGYTFAVYWCGCFVCWCVVKAGKANIPTRIRLGFGPYICQDANAGQNGLKAVPFDQAQPGDILVLWGGDHIELIVEKPRGDQVHTVGGNTGDGNAVNGDGVYARVRTRSDAYCVARPAY